jgi:hypothetical protein
MREHIDEGIRTHGWAGIGVGGTEIEPEIPFLYTVGLHDRGMPELLIIGGVSHTIIKQAISAIEATPATDGMVLDDIEGMRVILRALPAEAAAKTHTRFSAQYYGKPVDCMQIVFPDAEGLYPWEAGCDLDTAEGQSGVVRWRDEIRH